MLLGAREDLHGAGDIEALHLVEDHDEHGSLRHASILRGAGDGRNDEQPTFPAMCAAASARYPRGARTFDSERFEATRSDEGEIHVFRAIADVLRQIGGAIATVVTLPFRALARLFGGASSSGRSARRA
ncbi:hypothetical protein SGLAM104S_09931 [Streptomyces glaucescens]